MADITREMIHDYLHDALPAGTAASVEKAIREQPALQAMVHQIRHEVDRGEHSVGAIWRRERLSCPNREQLAGFLQEILDAAQAEYIEFHLKTISCPYCQANFDDLTRLQAEGTETRSKRRKRILDSSVGVLRDVAGR